MLADCLLFMVRAASWLTEFVSKEAGVAVDSSEHESSAQGLTGVSKASFSFVPTRSTPVFTPYNIPHYAPIEVVQRSFFPDWPMMIKEHLFFLLFFPPGLPCPGCAWLALFLTRMGF